MYSLHFTDTSGQPQNSLAKEILENLTKFSHCLLLTRVGQFYEVKRLYACSGYQFLTKILVVF
jgi:hypothetical protein